NNGESSCFGTSSGSTKTTPSALSSGAPSAVTDCSTQSEVWHASPMTRRRLDQLQAQSGTVRESRARLFPAAENSSACFDLLATETHSHPAQPLHTKRRFPFSGPDAPAFYKPA